MQPEESIQVFEGNGRFVGNIPQTPAVALIPGIGSAVNLTKQAMPVLVSPAGKNVSFPFPQARSGQLSSIDEIDNHLRTGSNVLFCASTGFGKSPTLVGLASLFKNSWMIVGRNDLVEQWRSDFEHLQDMGFLKSRDQFQCTNMAREIDKDGRPYTCRTGSVTCKSIVKQVTKIAQMTASDIRKHKEEYGELMACPKVLINDPAVQPLIRGMGKVEKLKDAALAWLGHYKCPYISNRDQALSARHTIMTLSMALTIFTYLKDLPTVQPRALLLIDECSELESELIKFYEVVIKASWVEHLFGGGCRLDKILDDSDPIFINMDPAIKLKFTVDDLLKKAKPQDKNEALEWLKIMSRMAKVKRANLTLLAEAPANDLSKAAKEEEAIQEIDDFLRRLDSCEKGMSLNIPYHFACEGPGSSYTVKLAPLEARGLFEQVLGGMADHCVFTSATTGTADLFKNTHGLTKPLVFLEGGSPFPAGHRPVFFTPLGNLTKKNIDQDIRGLCDGIVKIAMNSKPGDPFDHINQKGLIHTFTNRVTQDVVEAFTRHGLRDRIMVLSGSGQQRNAIVQVFKSSLKPLILISPSAMLGLSLDDDNGRWQIVAKVPYANLGDPSIEHRKNVIPGWYSWQTTKDLIQSFGRIVRSPSDWGSTYIVDASFLNHWKWNRAQFPRYVQEALKGV